MSLCKEAIPTWLDSRMVQVSSRAMLHLPRIALQSNEIPFLQDGAKSDEPPGYAIGLMSDKPGPYFNCKAVKNSVWKSISASSCMRFVITSTWLSAFAAMRTQDGTNN